MMQATGDGSRFIRKDVDSVAEWLEEKGIKTEFCEIFADNLIDGESFLDLTESDVRSMIGPIGIVKHIMRLQAKVFAECAADEASLQVLPFSNPPPLSPSLPPGQPLTPASSASNMACHNPQMDVRVNAATIRLEAGVPVSFAMPGSWSPGIQSCIDKKEMPPKFRTAMVRSLVVHLYSYGSRPSRNFCQHAARQLVLKYPFLCDASGTGYGSWEIRIVNRVYNEEKKEREKRRRQEEGGQYSRKRQKRVEKYPPIDVKNAPDQATYNRYLFTLGIELRKETPNEDVVLQLMLATFITRRQHILEAVETSEAVLDKFPAFTMPDVVVQEMQLIVQKQGIQPAFRKSWQEKWVPAIITYAGKCTKKTKALVAESTGNDSDDRMAVKVLSALFTVLATKDKSINALSYWLEEYDVHTCAKSGDDAAEEPPLKSVRISRFAAEEEVPMYYVFVEQRVLCQCDTLIDALLVWFCSHYIFHIQYHKYYREAALFIQEFIFELPDPCKKSANYLSMSTEINKYASMQ